MYIAILIMQIFSPYHGIKLKRYNFSSNEYRIQVHNAKVGELMKIIIKL